VRQVDSSPRRVTVRLTPLPRPDGLDQPHPRRCSSATAFGQSGQHWFHEPGGAVRSPASGLRAHPSDTTRPAVFRVWHGLSTGQRLGEKLGRHSAQSQRATRMIIPPMPPQRSSPLSALNAPPPSAAADPCAQCVRWRASVPTTSRVDLLSGAVGTVRARQPRSRRRADHAGGSRRPFGSARVPALAASTPRCRGRGCG